MSHSRRWNQLEHGVEHAEPCPQDRDDHDIAAHVTAWRGAERCVDGRVLGRDVAQGFGDEENADAIGGLTELFRRRPLVAERRERVMREGMIDEVKRHGATLYTEGARWRAQG